MNAAFEKFDLTGKTALVTGGAAGIGYNMARALAQSGAKVLIAARRESVLQESARKLTAECDGNEVLFRTVDLSNRESVADLVSHCDEVLGGVDIFVGNAAQDVQELVGDIKNETLDYMLEMNVSANIHLFRAFLPHMRRNRWGRVIYISSITTLACSPDDATSIYVAAKGALNTFTKNAAVETARDGITVNCLLLGFFFTEIIEQAIRYQDELQGPGAGKAFLDNLTSMAAIGRPIDCAEIEGIIQLLASDAGSAITGTNTVVDGGMSIMLRPSPLA